MDELDPNHLEFFAWWLNKQNRKEEAKEALTRALIYRSHDHGILIDLGRLYLADFHDPVKALPFIEKAVQLKPMKAWYWFNYGWALHQLGDCKAIEAFQQYKRQCLLTQRCDSDDIDWAKKTLQRLIWKQGCWREHPTLKLIGSLVKRISRFAFPLRLKEKASFRPTSFQG